MNRFTHTIRLFALLALITLLGGILAACGEDTPDEESSESALSVGDQAPAFTLPTASGGEVALADYTGKQPVLLFFHMAAG